MRCAPLSTSNRVPPVNLTVRFMLRLPIHHQMHQMDQNQSHGNAMIVPHGAEGVLLPSHSVMQGVSTREDRGAALAGEKDYSGPDSRWRRMLQGTLNQTSSESIGQGN